MTIVHPPSSDLSKRTIDSDWTCPDVSKQGGKDKNLDDVDAVAVHNYHVREDDDPVGYDHDNNDAQDCDDDNVDVDCFNGDDDYDDIDDDVMLSAPSFPEMSAAKTVYVSNLCTPHPDGNASISHSAYDDDHYDDIGGNAIFSDPSFPEMNAAEAVFVPNRQSFSKESL